MKHKEWLDRLLSILYPPRCVCCGAVLSTGERLCEPARNASPALKRRFACSAGKAFRIVAGNTPKLPIKRSQPRFIMRTPSERESITLKFRDRPQYAAYFAQEMAASIRANLPGVAFDQITCVPMRTAKEKERGYNQSALLAQELSKLLEIPVHCHLLRKCADTPAQHELKGAERRGNVFGVFEVAKPELTQGKTILLCDDVKTTGATLDECAKMLKLAGGAGSLLCMHRG